MNNKVVKFELDPKTLKVKELLNKDFLELEIKAISTAYPNRNNSHFTSESLQKAIPTFYNKPILGSFSVNLDDFRAHEGDLDYDEELDNLYYDYTDGMSETPLGLIRGNDKIEIYHDNKDNLDWIKFTCAIWVKYNYRQVKKLLKSKNGQKKISVEVEVNSSEFDEKGIEIIKDFDFCGVTILGDKYETGIADASMTILDMVDNAVFQKKQKALCFAYDSFDKENQFVETPDNNQDSNKNNTNDIFSNNEIIENESPKEEIEMEDKTSEEGGESKMNLTAQMKISLLEQYIVEYYKNNRTETECCPWVWVNDIDEVYVYFQEDEVNYRTTYKIDEVSEEENKVYVDIENKERVIRSWTVFSEDEQNNESNEADFAEKPEENKECESCGDKQEESCGKQEESCGNKENETCNETCENSQCESCENSEKESCGECKETKFKKCESDDSDDQDEDQDNNQDEDQDEEQDDDSKSEEFAKININEEPTNAETNTDDKSAVETLGSAVESIAAPEIQTEPENLGDANAAAAPMLNEEHSEAEVVAAELEISDQATLSVGVGPDGQKAEVVSENQGNEESGEVVQPDDNAKEEIFESNVSTVDVDGVTMTIDNLLEKYNELKETSDNLRKEFDKLNEVIKEQKAGELVKFAEEFINSDNYVDEETKKNYIDQISEKCKSFEFTTEEQITSFAKSLLAMYYYENQVAVKKNNSKEFGIDIQQPITQNQPNASNRLKDAINKLNHVNNK